jgi:hypothetical protein
METDQGLSGTVGRLLGSEGKYAGQVEPFIVLVVGFGSLFKGCNRQYGASKLTRRSGWLPFGGKAVLV